MSFPDKLRANQPPNFMKLTQSDPSLWPLEPQLCPRAGRAGSLGGLILPGGVHVLFPTPPALPPAAGAAGATYAPTPS